MSDNVALRYEMDEFLGNKYVLVNSENFDEYLKFIGVGYIARKVAMSLKQTVSLTANEDGSYSYEFSSPMTGYTIVFNSGEEIEEVRPDGVKLRSRITIEDNIMTHTQTYTDGKTCQHVLEFFPDKLITTTTVAGLNKTVKRYYEVR